MQATQRIAGYDSFEQIALGGMAAVYKARKISLDKPVAVKVLYPHLAQDAVFIERFKREARVAAKVQHDNIVNVIDYGEADGTHYIVMEYYDGLTLEDLLKEHSVIPLDICFAVILNVCYGLEAAHSEGLVHRDVKPANVILTKQGSVKIADFGLAKDADQARLVTQADKVVGTPAYMSPEQTRGEPVGAPSDIFSLGVVAHELLCSVRPFEGRTYSAVVDKIQFHNVERISGINPLVDDSFADIITKMLEKEISKRYRHISEVLLDLEEAVDKQNYKRKRRALSDYFRDPDAYLQKFNEEQLEKLRTRPPRPDRDGVEAQVLYYSRVLALDPADAEAKSELKRLGGTGLRARSDASERTDSSTPRGSAGADPDAEYRVFLDGIDTSRETAASFALKLSMRVRSPLPRIKALVNNMPSLVVGHVSLRKAEKLCKIIEELGGRAHFTPHEEESARVRDECLRAEPARNSSGEADPPAGTVQFDQEKTEQYHPIRSARSKGVRAAAKPSIICPKCGWEGDADARFCPICLFEFNKTETIDLNAVARNVTENPLQERVHEHFSAAGLVARWSGLPTKVKGGLLVTLFVLALLIIFSR